MGSQDCKSSTHRNKPPSFTKKTVALGQTNARDLHILAYQTTLQSRISYVNKRAHKTHRCLIEEQGAKRHIERRKQLCFFIRIMDIKLAQRTVPWATAAHQNEKKKTIGVHTFILLHRHPGIIQILKFQSYHTNSEIKLFRPGLTKNNWSESRA